jgi:hypothetical protein
MKAVEAVEDFIHSNAVPDAHNRRERVASAQRSPIAGEPPPIYVFM